MLVKHAQPVLDGSRPARDWELGAEGEQQAVRLAGALERFAPFRLVSSPEPKAARTAALVAGQLGIVMDTIGDLRELDRPVLPILPAAEHQRLNARVFAARDEAVLGAESASAALARFTAAIRTEMVRASGQNLVAMSHGTVISLLVGACNPVDAFEVWQRLQCPSFVVLDGPSLALIDVVDSVAQRYP
ncbi:MAG TPA: histidine phosphatase family protein [Vicinamibacterales bacterium]|nr:histidine phosphatase family protein [Vicinamibacterales bacterium]